MGSMKWRSFQHVQHLLLFVLTVKAELSRFVGIFMVATNLLTVVVSLAFFGDQAWGVGERYEKLGPSSEESIQCI